MRKQKAKKSKKSKRQTTSTKTSSAIKTTWVDKVLSEWVPLHDESTDSGHSSDENETTGRNSQSFGLVSWNVLADSYCRPRSHAHLPVVYQKCVFDRTTRQRRVRHVLSRIASGLAPDFIALQEVDEPLEVPKCLNELGYAGHHTPTDPSAKDGRVDACALYYRKDMWETIDAVHVRLDDLSMLSTPSKETTNDSETTPPTPSRRASIQGIQNSFIRKNMALLVRLKHLSTSFEVTIAVVHLFWNPEFPDVKLCQAHYVALKTCEFAVGSKVIVVGDTNSVTESAVRQYFTSGSVDATRVAPWYKLPSSTDSIGDVDALESKLESLAITGATPYHGLRYLVDYSLNRLCRWLRILGIDCEIETEAEERQRTKEGNVGLFTRAKTENRTLVTASSRIIQRKGCPSGTYLLDTQALSNLEDSLVNILRTHGVTLEPRQFLTRCVVCNAGISRVRDTDRIKQIFENHQAPESLVQQDLDVFQCSGCTQGYWYNDQPNSSASRVKNQATHLLETCIMGGVPVGNDLGMFDFVDVEEVASRVSLNETKHNQFQSLDILDWLRQRDLKNPLGALRSAYGDEAGRETLPFTNVTHDFVGHLDYIFHDPVLEVQERMHVPTTSEELNEDNVRNGHLLPSNIWPSDHLAIGARFVVPEVGKEEGVSTSQSLPSGQAEANATKTMSGVDGDSPPMFCLPEGSAPPLVLSKTETNATSTISGVDVDLPPLFCLPEGSAPPPALSKVPASPKAIEQEVHPDRCACGCVPKILSLFEMAELRKKARMKKGP